MILGRATACRSLLFLPLGCAAALAALCLLPVTLRDARLTWAFLGAALVLGVWTGLLLAVTRRRRRDLTVAVILRSQHYIQACAQGMLLLYWGWYWRGVYDAAHLFAAQLLFAYGFDALMSWTRHRSYRLGFAPIPMVFSINLFLWFKPDWFFLQFPLIALGIVVKDLWRWTKDGQRVHIFNPSSFPLALCSLGLIITDSTELTWGQEIATTLNDAPHIYLVIFLISLPGQLRFGVATMTMSAVVTMYLFGVAYVALVGTYYFVDAYIPIAVFLGMHLLLTDPSTSPRSELGRVIFGVVYALSVIALYSILGAVGAPRFYDKLLAVPVMNLLVRGIDRVARSATFLRLSPGTQGHGLAGRRRHLSVGAWTIVFIGMSAAHGVGDTHRGQWVTFWQQACAENRPNGCRQFGVMVSTYCDNGSGWACNEYGVLLQPQIRPALAAESFRRACDLRFSAGCANADPARATRPLRAAPTLDDYEIVLQHPKGPRSPSTPPEAYARACAQGFLEECAS